MRGFARFVALVGLIAMAEPSLADEWVAKVDGPDVFGNTKVFAAQSGAQANLVVRCDQKDSLFIAMIFRKKEFDKVAAIPAELLIQTNGGAPTKLKSMLRNWYDNYGGVVSDSRDEVIQVIQAIGADRGKINVGADIAGNQASETFSSQGSKSAMERVIKSCKLDGGGKPS